MFGMGRLCRDAWMRFFRRLRSKVVSGDGYWLGALNWASPRAARGQAVALRVEPPSCVRRLAPCRATVLDATRPGRLRRRGWRPRPVPVPRDCGRFFLHAARERRPLDELTGVPFTPLRFVRFTPARSSPRSPATPDAGPLKALMCSHQLDRRASRCALWHVGRRAAAARGLAVAFAATAAPGKLAHRPRRCVARTRWQRVRQSSHRAPPSCAPVDSRGGLVGGSSSGGPGNWLTASAAEEPTHPQPFPVREGRSCQYADVHASTSQGLADRLQGVALGAKLHDVGFQVPRLARDSARRLHGDKPHVTTPVRSRRTDLPVAVRSCAASVRRLFACVRSLFAWGSVALRSLFAHCCEPGGLCSLDQFSASIAAGGVLDSGPNPAAQEPRFEPILNA